MKYVLVALSLAFAAVASFAQTFTPGSAEDSKAVAEPTKRAMHLLDSGEAGAAWDESSKVLQEQTGRLAFIAGMKGMRAAVGDVKARNLIGIGFGQDIPQSPKGRYAAAFFTTEFQRATVEEKYVFFLEGASWRLVGYFISKRIGSTKEK